MRNKLNNNKARTTGSCALLGSARSVPSLIILLIIINISLAYNVPMGLTGVVYDQDGSKANNSVMISVNNLNSSFFVQGNIRTDGSYAVAIDGYPGDTIAVNAWTDSHNTTRTINLEGVVHGFDLFLNLTDEESQEKTSPTVSILNNPVVVTGKVDIQSNNVTYEIKNLETQEIVYGVVSKHNIYADIITGRLGDNIEIRVSYGDTTEVISTTISDDIITGNFEFKKKSTQLLLVFLIILIAIGITRIIYLIKK